MTPAEALEAIDPLGVTIDEIEFLAGEAVDPVEHRTPVEGVAIMFAQRVERDVAAQGYPFTARDAALLDALSLEMAQRLAEMHSTMIAARTPIPPRVRTLEDTVARHEEKWLQLTGVADSNGRVGRIVDRIADIEARVPKDAEERVAEKSAIASARWINTKISAAVIAVVLALGSGVTMVKSKYDAVIEKRARDAAWREAIDASFSRIDKDINRLFELFNLNRTPGLPSPTPPSP